MQPKWLKPVVEVMKGEPTTQEVLLEQSELLGELWDLQARQLGVLEKHLEELKRAWRLISVIGYTLEELVEHVSWVGRKEWKQKWKWGDKEYSGSKNCFNVS